MAIFKLVVTPVRPPAEILPRDQNRLRPLNFNRDSRFYKATYLPQFFDQDAPKTVPLHRGRNVFCIFILRLHGTAA